MPDIPVQKTPCPRVLVAGGATGIGAATALAFLQQGAQVLVADLKADNLAGLQAAAAGLPGHLVTEICDLAAAPAPAHLVARIHDRFGGLDCLFVNAGLMLSARLDDWTPEMWHQSLAVNLTLPMFLTRAAAPMLRRSRNASVIFTSSTGALRGHAGMPAYHATKAGLLGLVRALADELGSDGIRVNALLPGWVDTPFNDSFWTHQRDPDAARHQIDASIPLRRHGTPDEVAGTVLFLASEAARYVTGTQLVVDGGYTAV